MIWGIRIFAAVVLAGMLLVTTVASLDRGVFEAGEITDYSFRVRPLSVTYVDSDSGEREEDRFAFLIEDDSDVAKRNGLKKLEVPKVLPNRLDPQTASEFALEPLAEYYRSLLGQIDLLGCDETPVTLIVPPKPVLVPVSRARLPMNTESSTVATARYRLTAPPRSASLKRKRELTTSRWTWSSTWIAPPSVGEGVVTPGADWTRIKPPSIADIRVADGAMLLDVRSTEEFARGHIDGAVSIPIQELSNRLDELGDRNETVVIYCQSGGRSMMAKRLLEGKGFTDVHDLGGIGRW